MTIVIPAPRRRALLGAAVLLALSAGAASAQDYPVRQIRMVAPAPAGGGTDFLARLIGKNLTERLGQPVVVDNRSGANGNIGAENVARSAPDGYTLLMSYVGTQAINPSLYRTISWQADDFQPVAEVVSYPFVIAVNPAVPAHTLKEFITVAKSRPGEFNFGSAGAGSGGHLVGEMFNMLTGTKLVHIPYKGSAPVVADTIAGRLQITFDTIGTTGPHIKAGKLRPLAITSAQRLPDYPDIPTTAELGLPQMNANGWYGLFAPKDTPRPVVDKLNKEIHVILQQPDVRGLLLSAGYQLVPPQTPDQFSAFVKAETENWAKVVKISGAQVN